ncbi:acid-sensing ion channel 5 isoform X1 [Brachionus plicatilis]|uniref:Acid-sensing ion channel 5 isoform X1 n=1 Tax=Brachionus plicatilis TaxID=10195 RepID=A0A3M7RTJ9_BRAPC|nr:acid-sensing ion channel 5 isoform X1 [Brachionus plicatilis]
MCSDKSNAFSVCWLDSVCIAFERTTIIRLVTRTKCDVKSIVLSTLALIKSAFESAWMRATVPSKMQQIKERIFILKLIVKIFKFSMHFILKFFVTKIDLFLQNIYPFKNKWIEVKVRKLTIVSMFIAFKKFQKNLFYFRVKMHLILKRLVSSSSCSLTAACMQYRKKMISSTQNSNINLKNKLKNWILDSSSHGFPKIFKNEKPILKIIWTLCILLSIGFCCFFVIKSVVNYTKYEVTTLVRRKIKLPLELPALSICHNEMFLTPQGYTFKTELIVSSIYQESSNIDYFSYFARLKSFDYNVSDETKKSFGFNLDSYMVSCFFGIQSCETEEFIWYLEHYFGSCYLFNTGKYRNGSRKEFSKQTNVGSIYGFRMEFLSKKIDELTDLSESRGIHISLFDPKTRVNPWRGINVASKYITNINVRKRMIKKIPHPYSDCLEDHSKFFSSEIYQATKTQAESYSQYLCFECLSLQFMEFFSNSDVSKKCEKDCPLECERIEYDYTVSLTDYPTDLVANGLVELMKKKNSSKNYSLDYVNVFYDSLEYESIEELEKMDIVDLVSSIGGLLGLFIGISVLSFAEIIEILILIVDEIFLSKSRRIVINVQNISGGVIFTRKNFQRGRCQAAVKHFHLINDSHIIF